MTFANAGGTHDGAYPAAPTAPGTAWEDLSRTFAEPGRYDFVCGTHPDMVGVIEVKEPAATPTATATATATPTPSGSPPPEVRSLELAARTFCTVRGRYTLRLRVAGELQPALRFRVR